MATEVLGLRLHDLATVQPEGLMAWPMHLVELCSQAKLFV